MGGEQVADVRVGRDGGVEGAAFALDEPHESVHAVDLIGDSAHAVCRREDFLPREHPSHGPLFLREQAEIAQGELFAVLVRTAQRTLNFLNA